ncbi:MAG: tRNA (adenosine(37)-N6)-dimethylallyltransferase MiaA [Christensenellaceae bacterium]|jgi:tRNA dimethylallyltransferase|nr:tRNA (adenosine(37)-N6)-dimethylallyltransferase MiaA [Christensenellaceae bacterium]
MKKPKILVITGPTGSGKTDIAIECAKQFNGEIVSADSMQIYKDMDIGTGKVAEKQGVPHYMLDIINPDQGFSVKQYKYMAQSFIDDILARNKVPIIVGGTGFYISALIFNMSFGNTGGPTEVRGKYRKLYEEHGSEYLYDMLKRVDSKSAEAIDKNNIKKIIRALEIFEVTGKPKSEINDPEPQYDFALAVLNPPREKLYQNINRRFDDMIRLGLFEEIKRVVKQYNLTQDCQSMQAIGYREFLPYLNDQDALEQQVSLAAQHSRNFAKRQITYFKGFKTAVWIDPILEKNKIFDYFKDFLSKK